LDSQPPLRVARHCAMLRNVARQSPHHESQQPSRNKPEIIARLFTSTGIPACADVMPQHGRRCCFFRRGTACRARTTNSALLPRSGCKCT
jgi:hypothetical protein